VDFLRHAQDTDGGFGQYAGSDSNAQSTAWAVQGLLAAGRNPDSLQRGGRTPLGFIASLVRPDGSIAYSRSSSQTAVGVTAQPLRASEPIARAPDGELSPAVILLLAGAGFLALSGVASLRYRRLARRL